MFHFIVTLLTVIFLAHTSKGALNIKKFNTILITCNVVQVLPTGNSTNQLTPSPPREQYSTILKENPG